MTGEGLLLLATILLGAPVGIILWGIWFNWWVHGAQPDFLVYDGLKELREILLEQYRED